MTISLIPTASYIRIESRLKPSQVNVAYNETTLEGDIQARIDKYHVIINDDLASVADTPAHQVKAAEALSLRVLASLYHSAGHLSPIYWEFADRKMAEFKELMASLLGTVDVDGDGSADSGPADSPRSTYRIVTPRL